MDVPSQTIGLRGPEEAGPVRSPAEDLIYQLQRLAKLRDDGVLSAREFNARQTLLLAE